MKTYNQLTPRERDRISLWLAQGMTQAEVARRLDRHPSTISRELKRNSHNGEYLPSLAQEHYRQRRKVCHPHLKMADLHRQAVVFDGLERGWSPEIIVGRWRRVQGIPLVCVETLYRFIYWAKTDPANPLYEYLKQAHHKRRKSHGSRTPAGCLGPRRFIEERPVEANQRLEIGHWETDTFQCAHRRGINILADRKSRFIVLSLLLARTAAETTRVLIQRLLMLPVASLTADNGSEFAGHEEVSRILRIPVFFCHAYHAWEKGTVENTIGRLRWMLTRKTDLTEVSEEELQDIADELNHTPRKCLDFQTPFEVISQGRCTWK